MKTTSLTAALILTLSLSAAHAQERYTPGTLQAEANWTAMKNLVTAADMKAEAAQILIEAMRGCAEKGLLYNPSATTADDQGCNASIATVSPTIQVFGGYGGSNAPERNIGVWDACYISRYSTVEDNHTCEVRQAGQLNNNALKPGRTSTMMDYTPDPTLSWIFNNQGAQCAATCIKFK